MSRDRLNADLENLQDKLHIFFKDKKLLQQAFTHASYTNENPDFPQADNERLEFLGDAILNFIVSRLIFNRYPELPEGNLTEIRSRLIREETLARIASSLNLGNYLLLSKGEENSGGRTKKSNLADTMESLLGAIFLDQGLANVEHFLTLLIDPYLEAIGSDELIINYKGKLQEFTQLQNNKLPTYHLIGVTGPDHDRNFTVEVNLDDSILGKGSGKSKKTAEMDAARSACKKLGI